MHNKTQPFYIKLNDNNNGFFDNFNRCDDIRDVVDRYLHFRGCREVEILLTKYKWIIRVVWFPVKCSEYDIFEELKEMCNEFGDVEWATNLRELVEDNDDTRGVQDSSSEDKG